MTATGAPLVELHGVWRRYRMSRDGRSATLRGTISGGRRSLRRDWFWALRGVDLALHRGEAVAVIGPNGAGKSTLLRLAGGLGRPDRGSVRRSGRIGAMLDLGRELHPDLTGRENAELVAVVAGLTRAEFRRRVGAMLDFAGLHDFAEQPLHVYSDGMRARLAFSVLAHVEPDVLLVDEVLAVGDHAFQERCIDRIEQMRTAGTGVLLVSHDLHTVQRVCDRALWLQAGEIRGEGDPIAVTRAYLRPTRRPAVDSDGGTAIHDVALRDPWGSPLSDLRPGQGMRVSWGVSDDPEGRRRRTSVVIQREGRNGPVVDTSTPLTAAGESFEVAFARLDLAAGRHHVTVAVYDEAWAECLDSVTIPLDVRGGGPDAVLAPPHDWIRQR